tara:strand:+ start:384 stop:1355 length:972 start_codon:yes stop_codon:yes gene_type:complete
MPTEELFFSTTLLLYLEDPMADPEKMDAVNATTWSDYQFLTSMRKTDDNLLEMGVPTFSQLSYQALDGFNFNPNTDYYPVVCRSTVNEPIWYERVRVEDVDSRPDVANMQILSNIEYEVAQNINTYFLLTTQNIETAQALPNANALTFLNERAAALISDQPDAGWEVDIGIGDVADVLNTMIDQVVNGIAPPLDGKEIYAKIKEGEFRIDNFISTNLTNIEIPKIINTTPVAVGPTAKIGGFIGTSTEGRLLDDDWFVMDEPYSGEFLESETTAEEFFDDFSDGISPTPTPDEDTATFDSDFDMGGGMGGGGMGGGGGGGYGY